ncbi:MAG: hypothetical protein ACVCEJ_07720 [Candidatus Izemoplasmataceae bacterium]
MKKYVEDFVRVINHINNNNTYKAAWALSIIDCIEGKEYEEIDDSVVIEEYFIVKHLLKYYWNLNVIFDIHQGGFLVIEKMIEELKGDIVKHQELSFKQVDHYLKQHQITYERLISKIIQTVNQNVAYRFLNLYKEKVPLYKFDSEKKVIVFHKEDIQALKEHKGLIKNLLIYKWAKYLEHFNEDGKMIHKLLSSRKQTVKKQEWVIDASV